MKRYIWVYFLADDVDLNFFQKVPEYLNKTTFIVDLLEITRVDGDFVTHFPFNKLKLLFIL